MNSNGGNDLNRTDRAELATLAYEPDMERITERLGCLYGLRPDAIEYVYVKRTDTEGFLCRIGDALIISFSGTESLRDLLQDAIFLPSRMYGGLIHSGFKQVIKLIEAPVRQAAGRLFDGDPIRRVYAQGHSLGAPVTMGACDALWNPDTPADIVTFGCPNGWTRGARSTFNTRHPGIVNYINPGDYVTWMLGITSGRPGRDIKLAGRWGHSMGKYTHNLRSA